MRRNGSHAKQAIKLFQQINALSRVGAAFLFKYALQKRECYPSIADERGEEFSQEVDAGFVPVKIYLEMNLLRIAGR
jgi:hypothetical protein